MVSNRLKPEVRSDLFNILISAFRDAQQLCCKLECFLEVLQLELRVPLLRRDCESVLSTFVVTRITPSVPIVEFVLQAILALPQVGNDIVAARLLRTLGVEGITAGPIALATSQAESCQSSLIEELAERNYSLALTEFVEGVPDWVQHNSTRISNAACLAILEARFDSASKLCRWCRLVNDPVAGELREMAVYLQQIHDLSPESLFHISIGLHNPAGDLLH